MGILIQRRKDKIEAASRFKTKEKKIDEVETVKAMRVGIKREIKTQGTWRRKRPVRAQNEVDSDMLNSGMRETHSCAKLWNERTDS